MTSLKQSSKGHVCAVCGYRHLNAAQRIASGAASHEICPCCGFESGFSDDVEGQSFEQWRSKWVAGGMAWFSKGTKKPHGWNPMIDLHALLKRKRPVVPQRYLDAAARLATAAESQPPTETSTASVTADAIGSSDGHASGSRVALEARRVSA